MFYHFQSKQTAYISHKIMELCRKNRIMRWIIITTSMQKGQSDNRDERSLFIQEKIVLPFRYCFTIFAILPSFLFPISFHTVGETTSFSELNWNPYSQIVFICWSPRLQNHVLCDIMKIWKQAVWAYVNLLQRNVLLCFRYSVLPTIRFAKMLIRVNSVPIGYWKCGAIFVPTTEFTG